MRHDRRQALKVLSTLAIGGAIAGCIGDGTSEPEEEDVDLGIEHIRLVTEEPAGYRDYDELEEPAYPADAVAWFYLEPVGLSTESAGAGEVRIELTASLAITDPTGEDVLSTAEPIHRDIPEGSIDELYLFFHFSPGSPVLRGEYTATFTVTDEYTGEEVTDTTSFRIEGDRTPVGIENLRFVDQPPAGYGQYTPRDDVVYGPDEPIWLYAEPTGLSVGTRNGVPYIQFSGSVSITDPDGEDIGGVFEEFDFTLEDEDDVEEAFVYFELNVREPLLGTYNAEVRIQDQLDRSDATESVSFEIDDDDLRMLDVFEEVVLDETDIEIERLVFRNETVTIEYQSPHSYEDENEEIQVEIAVISGGFAGLLEAGFSGTMVRGLFEDADGTEWRYRIEDEFAHRYNDGELTEEEYVTEVLGTLREE